MGIGLTGKSSHCRGSVMTLKIRLRGIEAEWNFTGRLPAFLAGVVCRLGQGGKFGERENTAIGEMIELEETILNAVTQTQKEKHDTYSLLGGY